MFKSSFIIIVALFAVAAPVQAAPVVPFALAQATDAGKIVLAGSSRSARTGRFVTRGYANRNRSTTVTHGKY